MGAEHHECNSNPNGNCTMEEQENKKHPRSARTEYRLEGAYEQGGKSNAWMVRVRAPGCRWPLAGLSAVAKLARRFGDGRLHLTTRGDVELHGIDVSHLPRVFQAVKKAGFTTRGACGDTVRNIVACPGTGLCPNERYPAGELAYEIAEQVTGVALYESLPRKFKVSVSGCEHACASPQIQDLGFVAHVGRDGRGGEETGFHVYMAGGLGRHSLLGKRLSCFLPPADVPLFVHAALAAFHELGERKRRHRARMKFLAEQMGHEALMDHVMERIKGQAWNFQI